jgi:hypothetical protein
VLDDVQDDGGELPAFAPVERKCAKIRVCQIKKIINVIISFEIGFSNKYT